METNAWRSKLWSFSICLRASATILLYWIAFVQRRAKFFQMRDDDELSERPWGYENCFHVADSFPEFIGKMRRNSL